MRNERISSSARSRPRPTSFTTMPRWAGRNPSLRLLRSSGVNTSATLLVYAGTANPHHPIATLLKLIRHLLDGHLEAAALQLVGNRIHMPRRHRAERQQWKHAYFTGDAGHLENRRLMKRLVELLGIEEQKMRAERELERTVSKRQ